MASYQIEWKNSARKELRKLPPQTIHQIVGAIESLKENPHPPNCRKLVGSEHTWRIRSGNYRVVYNILSSILTIEIIRIAHRKDAYPR